MKNYSFLIIVFLLSFSSIAFSQIQLSGSGYSQNFDSLAYTGTSDFLPYGWYLIENGSNADSLYSTGTGSSTTGDTYSFGPEDNTERALGSLQTGTVNSVFGANFINNSGDVITSLQITYTGEQWRAGSASRTEPDTLKFQYSLNATNLSDGDWTDINSLNFVSPKINVSGALDGNSPENRIEIPYTITGLTIQNGTQFWIKWVDVDVSDKDDGLAIDDFNIDLTAPPVIFSISPTSLNFDTVTIGNSKTLAVTVQNEGTTDDLEITNIEPSDAVFTISPNTFPINLPPGSTQVFNVTFTPADEGLKTGTINFSHNATGTPYRLSLQGIGKAPVTGGLLKFKSSVRNLLDGTKSNSDTVVLSGYSGQPLKALQFNLITGNSNGGLILRSVSRGSTVPEGQFNFSYEICRGTILPDGSSIDTVKVVIFGNGSNAIMPASGDQDILIFSYDIVGISGVTIQTFNLLSSATGATVLPVTNANLSTGPNETINIFNGTLEGLLGDVNLDNRVNILDILSMVDYILGKEEFNSEQFFNGDISPWNPAESLPTRDGKIDVLDLAVLQNIVLTDTYPSNSPVYKIKANPFNLAAEGLHKLTPGMDAKVTFYFTNEGISIGLETVKKVKGLQIELNNPGLSIPQNTLMTSTFNQALYYKNNSVLKMLVYDDQSTVLGAGVYLIATIPFKMSNPEDLVVQNLIVADEDNNSMGKIESEIIYASPSIPFEYNLSQNYPNPFNPVTEIKFSVPKDGYVTIKVFNIIGQEVITLFSGNAKAGIHYLSWDGTNRNGKHISSGSYIYRMKAGEFTQSKKMIYMK